MFETIQLPMDLDVFRGTPSWWSRPGLWRECWCWSQTLAMRFVTSWEEKPQTFVGRFAFVDWLVSWGYWTSLFVLDRQHCSTLHAYHPLYAKSMGLDTLNACCIVVPSMRKFDWSLCWSQDKSHASGSRVASVKDDRQVVFNQRLMFVSKSIYVVESRAYGVHMCKW